MKTKNETGRYLVIAIIAGALLISLFVMIAFIMFRGEERWFQQIVRFSLTFMLCTFLYRRSNWARCISIILFGLAGSIGFVLGLISPSFGLREFLMLGMGMFYLMSAIILFRDPRVQMYFENDDPIPK